MSDFKPESDENVSRPVRKSLRMLVADCGA
jgi:hypothetical protein